MRIWTVDLPAGQSWQVDTEAQIIYLSSLLTPYNVLYYLAEALLALIAAPTSRYPELRVAE